VLEKDKRISIDLDNEAIHSQVLEWEDCKWTVALPAALPLDPAHYSAYGFDNGISAIHLPVHAPTRRSACGDVSRVFRNFTQTTSEPRKPELREESSDSS
jgi:hypothetical protein